MIQLFEKAYSTYNKVTYLYSVVSYFGDDSDFQHKQIHDVLSHYGVDWGYLNNRTPIVFSSDGEVYFLSDVFDISFIGRNKDLSYTTYYSCDRVDLHELLYNTCTNTYNLYLDLLDYMHGDIKINYVSKKYDSNNNYLNCKVYLNSISNKDLFIKTIIYNYKPNLVGVNTLDITQSNKLSNVSFCGRDTNLIKFYFNISN
jgi:hypothetical protein